MGKKTKTQPPKHKAPTRSRAAAGKKTSTTSKPRVREVMIRGKTYRTIGDVRRDKRLEKQEIELAKKTLAEKRALENMKPSLLFASVVAEIKKEYPIDQVRLSIDPDYKRGPIMESFAAGVNKVLLIKEQQLGIKFNITTMYRQTWGEKSTIEAFCLFEGPGAYFLVARDEAAMRAIEIPLTKDDLLTLYRKVVL